MNGLENRALDDNFLTEVYELLKALNVDHIPNYVVKNWDRSDRPVECDVCGQAGLHTPAIVDGKTRFGPWGLLCQSCALEQVVTLGLGRGQILGHMLRMRYGSRDV